MRSYLLALLALMCGGIVAAQQSSVPQTPEQPTAVFRTGTNFVEVHAIVTDQKDAFVPDLTQNAFEIYEDGVPRQVAIFSKVYVPIERRFTPANASAPIEPDVRSTTRTFDGRLYLLVLDDLNTNVTRTNQVRSLAKRFLEQSLGRRDLAAVVYTSGRQESGQELTGSLVLLEASIDKFFGQKLPSANPEKLAIHVRRAEDRQLNCSPAADPTDPNTCKRTNTDLEQARSIRDPDEIERGSRARRTLDAIRNVSQSLADVKGRRKALLLFSEGIDYDIYQPFNNGGGTYSSTIVAATADAISAAQRANVSIYAIDPRGISAAGEIIDVNDRSDYPQLEYGTYTGALHELLLAQESLITLAEETGGIAIVNARDIPGGLGRIVLDNSRYYLLGYYSDSSRWGRKFLRIQVRVKRPGLQVRARRGFVPPDPHAVEGVQLSQASAGASSALVAALNNPLSLGEVPIRVFAGAVRGVSSIASVLVSTEIETSGLQFQPGADRLSESIEYTIVATNETAKVQGGTSNTLNLKLRPETYEQLKNGGVRLLSRLELPPGRYRIRVGVHESSGGGVSSIPYDLEIPDFSKMPFALSNILLTSSHAESYATANPDPEFGEVLAGALLARRSFHRDEILRSFIEVYDNANRFPYSILLTQTIIDARDGHTIFTARDHRDIGPTTQGEVGGVPITGQSQGFRIEMPLKGLAPGTYLLRASATSTVGGYKAEREIPFEVAE